MPSSRLLAYINIMQMIVGFRIVTDYKLVECCGGNDSKPLVVADHMNTAKMMACLMADLCLCDSHALGDGYLFI